MITTQDLHSIAHGMASQHGIVALEYADRAIEEMENAGDTYRTECWIALRDVLQDVLIHTESGTTEPLPAPVLH